MNCKPIRNRILAVEEAGHLPSELAAHLDECSACQAWYRKFVSVECALLELPVPESDGLAKIAVLERIRATSNAVNPTRETTTVNPTRKRGSTKETPESVPVLPEPTVNHKPTSIVAPVLAMPLNLADDLPKRKFSFGHAAAKLWPAGLVAATLLIGTIAWLSLRGERTLAVTPMPADPLLDKLVKLNVELAISKNQAPAERIKVLASIAEDLNQEMREIARADASGENMRALKEMYRKVVLNGLVSQAKLVDRRQREEVLGKIAGDLAQFRPRSGKDGK